MRHKLSASDAKNRFAHALRQAEGGDVVAITRFGKPAAALVGAERLARLEAAAADAAAAGSDEAAPEEPTPEELLERAAAASLRRIDYDLARLPEKLRPVLRLIRKNLFRPRLTVERIKKVMKVGSHDLTTQFRKRAGAPIRRYFEARRLEAAGRLLADTALEIGARG